MSQVCFVYSRVWFYLWLLFTTCPIYHVMYPDRKFWWLWESEKIKIMDPLKVYWGKMVLMHYVSIELFFIHLSRAELCVGLSFASIMGQILMLTRVPTQLKFRTKLRFLCTYRPYPLIKSHKYVRRNIPLYGNKRFDNLSNQNYHKMVENKND